MAPPKLYYYPAAPAAMGTLFAIRNLNIDVELVIIDVLGGENKKEAYLKVNPLGTVPALEDNGLVLIESKAIQTYLANLKAPGSKLYPSDPKGRALVDQRLYFDGTVLFPRGAVALRPILYGEITKAREPEKKAVWEALKHLDNFLTRSKWAAGPWVTLADFPLCTGVAVMKAIKVPMDDFPAINRWFEQCRALPGFDEVEQGCQLLAEAVLAKGSWE